VDRLLVDPTLPAGVPIARMVDPAMNAAMAETALWATLALHRGFFANALAQRSALWQQQAQRRTGALQVLVLGLGQMGQAAARAIAAHGYRVAGFGAHAREDTSALAGITCHHGAAALAALLPASDIVVNLLPLTAATRGLLDARLFARLPRGAAIVNLARGAHLVDDDLLAALDSGQIGHAVLDVFHTEPLPTAHAFWRHPRVTVLPHVAAQTDPDSAAQVVGAYWAYLGWATPLHWSARHLQSASLWCFYAALLHLRYQPVWNLKTEARFSLIGLALILIFPAASLPWRFGLWPLLLLAVINQELVKRKAYRDERRLTLLARLTLTLHLGMGLVFVLMLWQRL